MIGGVGTHAGALVVGGGVDKPLELGHVGRAPGIGVRRAWGEGIALGVDEEEARGERVKAHGTDPQVLVRREVHDPVHNLPALLGHLVCIDGAFAVVAGGELVGDALFGAFHRAPGCVVQPAAGGRRAHIHGENKRCGGILQLDRHCGDHRGGLSY